MTVKVAILFLGFVIAEVLAYKCVVFALPYWLHIGLMSVIAYAVWWQLNHYVIKPSRRDDARGRRIATTKTEIEIIEYYLDNPELYVLGMLGEFELQREVA